MGRETAIEWAHGTFNPWRGCEKTSPGCAHCYAETWAKRTGKRIWGPGSAREFATSRYWAQPLRWAAEAKATGKPFRVFCGSLMDVFEDREDLHAPRQTLCTLIECTTSLTWLLLTKRPQNINRLIPIRWREGGIPKNVWLGVTVENQESLWRADWLMDIRCSLRFLSMEPLLGPIDPLREDRQRGVLEPHGGPLGWVIVGGESGAEARPMDPEWVRKIRDDCRAAGVPFFFKQWGEWGFVDKMKENTLLSGDGICFEMMRKIGKKKAGRILDGRTWDEIPRMAQ